MSKNSGGEQNQVNQKEKIFNRIKLSYEKSYEGPKNPEQDEEEIQPSSLVMRLNKPREQRVLDFKPAGLRDVPLKREVKIE